MNAIWEQLLPVEKKISQTAEKEERVDFIRFHFFFLFLIFFHFYFFDVANNIFLSNSFSTFLLIFLFQKKIH